MHLQTLCLAALSAVAYATYPIELIYQFPNTSFVNIENVALRSSNGQLLLSLATGPRLVQLDPANPVPEDLIVLQGPGSLVGIAETSPDVFTVAAGNFSFGPDVPGGLAGIPGTFSVWSIDLTGSTASAKMITAIPEASALNGLSAVPDSPDLVLIADSGLGAVWSVNVKTGEYKNVIQAPEFLPTAAFALGINGLKVPRAGSLLFTNSALGTYGIVYISPEGYAAGSINIIANAPNGTSFDDFAVAQGTAWIATHPNSVYKVPYEGGLELVAGGGNSTELVSPTATVLSQGGCTLYVVTGGAGGPTPTSGQVFAVNVCAGMKAKKWTA